MIQTTCMVCGTKLQRAAAEVKRHPQSYCPEHRGGNPRDTTKILAGMLKVSQEEAREIIAKPLHRKFLDNEGVWLADGIYQVGRQIYFTIRYLLGYAPELHPRTWAKYADHCPELGRSFGSMKPFWPLSPNIRPLALSQADVELILERLRNKRLRESDPSGKGKWLSKDIFQASDGLLYGRFDLAAEKVGVGRGSMIHHRRAGRIRMMTVPDPWAKDGESKRLAPGKCLHPSCTNSAFSRGLCGKHYQTIRKDGSTWADRERTGQCLPPAKRPVVRRATAQVWCLEDADRLGQDRHVTGTGGADLKTVQQLADRMGIKQGKDRIAFGQVLCRFREECPDGYARTERKLGGGGAVLRPYGYDLSKFESWLNGRSITDPVFKKPAARANKRLGRARLFLLYVLSHGHFNVREFNAFLESPPVTIQPGVPMLTRDIWSWAKEARVPMRYLKDTTAAAEVKKALGIRMVKKGLERGHATWELKAPFTIGKNPSVAAAAASVAGAGAAVTPATSPTPATRQKRGRRDDPDVKAAREAMCRDWKAGKYKSFGELGSAMVSIEPTPARSR